MSSNRILHGQVVASSAVDDHGQKISRVDLKRLFDSTPDEVVYVTQHDWSQKPCARGFNKRLERQDSGEHAILQDIEVLDEDAFHTFGGFSIAFTGATTKLGAGPRFLEVLANPRHFDFPALQRELERLRPDQFTLELTERHEKALDASDAIIVIAILLTDPAREMWKGFWAAAGSSLFEMLRLQRRKDAANEGAALQVHITTPQSQGVIVLIPDSATTSDELATLDLADDIDPLVSRLSSERADRIVVRVHAGLDLQVCLVVHRDGTSESFGS